MMYGNNDAGQVLIDAGARLKGLLGPVMHSAAVSDNGEGILACLGHRLKGFSPDCRQEP